MPLNSAGSTASINTGFAAGRAAGAVTPCTGRVGDRTGWAGGFAVCAWSRPSAAVANRAMEKVARDFMRAILLKQMRVPGGWVLGYWCWAQNLNPTPTLT